jgi:hypothetical protein
LVLRSLELVGREKGRREYCVGLKDV